MTVSYGELILDEADSGGNLIIRGTVTIALSQRVPDAGDDLIFGQAPVTGVFRAGGPPSVRLPFNDTFGPQQDDGSPGTTYTITYNGVPGSPAPWSFYLLSTGGATQRLSELATSPVAQAGSLAVTSVFGRTGAVTAHSGDYTAAQVGAVPAGATIYAAQPAGETATDTPNVTAAIASLVSALAYGPVTLMFADGTYQVDSNSAVIRSVSNFAVRSSGATVITQAPNRSGNVNNTSGDLFVIADCTDFTVRDIALDCLRDTLSPIVPLSASASSGQPSVTVASGAASAYLAGQRLKLFGGLGTAEQAQSDGYGTSLVISSVTPGGGTGGGDLITFTVNLGNTYTQVSGSAVSDGYGPYANTGAYLTPYQTGSATVAGRTLTGEDQQSCLHLIACQRFLVTGMQWRNTWESGIRMGTGFTSTFATDGCSHGIVAGNRSRHGYDQGIGAWNSQDITISGNVLSAAGWAGVDLCCCDSITVTGNVLDGMVYREPTDLNDGNGIALNGSVGCTVTGNTIVSTYYNAIHLDPSVLFLIGNGPALTGSFLEGGATTLAVASTTQLAAGGKYSISDTVRTEAIQVQTVDSSTQVTLVRPTRFSHAAGVLVTARLCEENVFEGNIIQGTVYGSAVAASGVRNRFRGNVIRDSASHGISGTPIYDSAIEDNTVDGPALYGIYLGDGGAQVTVRRNRVTSPGNSTTAREHALVIDSVTDCDVTDNHVTGAFKAGIYAAATYSAPARVRVAGNMIRHCSAQGIIFPTGGSSLAVQGNTVASCGGAGSVAGIDLRGVTQSTVSGNTCVSNQEYGIILQDNGSAGCEYNTVAGNTCRDDGSGWNITSGGTWTQQYGIYETGHANYNLFTGNECDANGTGQIVTAGAASYAWANIISGSPSGGLPIALGGSGAATQQAAMDALAGAVTANQVLAGNGTHVTLRALAAADLPAGTTGAKGALQLDGTAGDIQPTGTAAAAGANGKAADSGHVHVQVFGGLFGDGSDGAVTLDGSTAYSGFASLAGSVYTLTRDVFATTLAVSGGVTLVPAGHRVFAAGGITGTGTIAANAGNGTAAAGGTSGIGFASGGGVGGAGATGNGGSPTGSSMNRFGQAGASGTGGNGGSGTGASGGSPFGGSTTSVFRTPAPLLAGLVNLPNSGTTRYPDAAWGGGGGGGDSTNSGGGGGGGGGLLMIFTPSVASGITLSAKGGNGATPATGNAGGGGAGSGGLIAAYTLSAFTGTATVAAGTAGSGAGSGTAGGNGSAGTFLNVIIQ